MTIPPPPVPLPATLVRRAVDSDAATLRRLWALFRHDMSAFTGELPDATGRYRSERLDHALAGDPGWAAWRASVGPHPVGLALARALDEDEHVLSSFFVVGAARRGGVGRHLARAVMTSSPGRWAVAYQDANAPAARFWADVAADLDPAWRLERRAVPGRPDLPPDCWVRLRVGG